MGRRIEKEQNRRNKREEKRLTWKDTHTLIPEASVIGTSKFWPPTPVHITCPRRHLVQDRICGAGECLDLALTPLREGSEAERAKEQRRRSDVHHPSSGDKHKPQDCLTLTTLKLL